LLAELKASGDFDRSVLDVLAQKIGMDPLRLRLKNAAKKGTQMLSGATLSHNGYAETIEALLNHPGYTAAPLGKKDGRDWRTRCDDWIQLRWSRDDHRRNRGAPAYL
jgi:CO/xanthine dehydrogenase Mo-binding subunit